MILRTDSEGQILKPEQYSDTDVVKMSGREFDKMMTYLTCARMMAEMGNNLSFELRNIEAWSKP